MMANNRIRNAAVAALMLAACLPAEARVMRGYATVPSGALTLTVDSIDFRRDLTRVYGKLRGRPHTSQRIDAATMQGHAATDIDGVDFRRYFQWEDDGLIPVELDFPAMKPASAVTVVLTTVRGQAKSAATKGR